MISKPVGLLYTGNALEVLRSMADCSVQMCVTSPPYWGLRDYGICSCRQGCVQHASSTLAGSQDGTPSEFSGADPDCAICNGTGRITSTEHIWGGGASCQHQWQSESVKGQSGGPSDKQKLNAGSRFAPSTCLTCSTCSAWYGSLGLEPQPELFIEHLVMLFREVQRVLRGDGTLWIVIGDSYYGGAGGYNPKYEKESADAGPKSFGGTKDDTIRVNQRQSRKAPQKRADIKTKDLVGVPWMLAFALRADGWFLRQDIIFSKGNPMPESVTNRCTKSHEYVFLLAKSEKYYFDSDAIKEDAVHAGKKVKLGAKLLSKGQANAIGIAASGNDTANEVIVAAKRNKRSVWHMNSAPFKAAHFATYPPELVTTPILAGSKPGDVVLDCFSGAATTGLVALELGREYIGLEQNPLYNEIARKRLTDAGLDCEVL